MRRTIIRTIVKRPSRLTRLKEFFMRAVLVGMILLILFTIYAEISLIKMF